MTRRLFFLFPDREHALRAVQELVDSGVDRARMHTVARDDIALDGLPEASPQQRRDLASRIEYWGWRLDLALFFGALLALIGLLASGNAWWWLPLLVMAGAYLAGQRFTRLPNAHLDEFAEAIHHGEILLMVDVDANDIEAVEQRVRKRHPEAVAGGSTWTLPAFDL